MISIQSYKLEELAEDLGRRKSHIETAMRRATGSFIQLVRNRVLEVASAKVGLPKAQMSQIRIQMKVERARMRASLWIGSSPIQVRYLNTRFTKKGVKAGGTLYPRSFMPWKKGGKSVILQRVGSERLPVTAPEVEAERKTALRANRVAGTYTCYWENHGRTLLHDAQNEVRNAFRISNFRCMICDFKTNLQQTYPLGINTL